MEIGRRRRRRGRGGDEAVTTRKRRGDGGKEGVTVAMMADADDDGCRRQGRCDDRRRGRGWDRIKRPIRSL